MKKLATVLLVTVISFSISGFTKINLNNENKITSYLSDWEYTTGYHSDGTSASIRYTISIYGDISDIEIKSSGYWYSTYIKLDNNGRQYVKNSNNKRYYF
jgi:hypothetical protein